MPLLIRYHCLLFFIPLLSCVGIDGDDDAAEVTSTAPFALQVTPDHPADHNTPVITGVAPDGAVMVALFTNPDCTEPAGAEGEVAAFEVSGFDVEVADDSETTFYAQSTDALGVTSPCSLRGVTYVERSTAIVLPARPVRPSAGQVAGEPVLATAGELAPRLDSVEIGAQWAPTLRVDGALSCEAPLAGTTVGAPDSALDWNPLCEPENGDTARWHGGERVIRFTVPVSGPYEFNLDWKHRDHTDLDLFVLRPVLSDGGFVCTDFAWAFPPESESVGFDGLPAGEQIIIVVDGFEGDEDAFTLTAVCPT